MQTNDFFDKFKSDVANIDPVAWAEKYLTLDGKPYRINGNGYKPLSDVLRYVCVKSLEKNSKPLIFCKGRQIGLTTLATVSELFLTASGVIGGNGRPNLGIIHCFPTLIHVYTFAKTKLNTMISDSVMVDSTTNKRKISYIESKLDKSTPANNSLQFKQFQNGNFLRVESTGLDADRLRGSTCSALYFDEVQDTPIEAIANALKLLTTSKYGPRGMELYFGTPKQKGSGYWKMWQASSQQYYHLGCEKCGEYFPLYTPGSDDWEKIWLYGYMVRCTKCEFIQDKRDAAERGKWIALNSNDDAPYIGYHLNQLYMPFFTKEDILKEKPENHPTNSEKVFQNEVMAEFYSGDSSPITPEEIHEKCADIGRKIRASISPAENKAVFGGYDWGKKKADSDDASGQSYSCCVLLSDDGKGLLSVEFSTLLKRNDFEEKKSIVDQMFRQYSVKLAVGDVGYGNDLTEVLQRSHGDKFLGSESSNHVNGHQKYVDDYFPKRIVFEKDYYIAEVYDLLKRGMIRFPYGDYEKISPLIQHICSMELKTTMNRIGEAQQKYVKGSTPNDLMMALVNAYLAYKFDITKGFKDQTGGLFNPGGSKGILAGLAYSPKR